MIKRHTRRSNLKHCFLTAIALLTSWGLYGQTSFTIPWGDTPESLGLQTGEEIERVGPLCFAVSPDADIYVADTIHRQIKRWHPNGQFGGIVVHNVRPTALAFDNRGNLLALEAHTVKVFSKQGELRRTLRLPENLPLIEGYAQEVFDENGLVGVNDPDETVYLFDPNLPTPKEPLQIRKGRRGEGGRRIFSRIENRKVELAIAENADERGPATVQHAFITPRFSDTIRLGAVIYRGMAGAKPSIICETEEIGPQSVRLVVRVLASDGKETAAYELPNRYFTTVYEKFEVLPDGTLWQMLTTPQGVTFTSRRVVP
ncbi:MAG: hypothetical protein KatS3mg130_1572 [Candidatus Sumerlaea sp.]|uniref:6-bladed beta-propeller n=1 Tax=Sumerlaea chitinivorans TaxID=2250252 RepID=A0A2Z4Y205_SUMC1|nr:hypothetical protein BRCON_0222 [Candidatus Sumerlaea chitinivorans]GIX45164.1 MAG: hypothetical protein KatS3mg130_1572 [Candidatus Sumerlaea sp.]